MWLKKKIWKKKKTSVICLMDKFLGIADKEVIFLWAYFNFKKKRASVAFSKSEPIVLGFNTELRLKSFLGHIVVLCRLALKMCSYMSHMWLSFMC